MEKARCAGPYLSDPLGPRVIDAFLIQSLRLRNCRAIDRAEGNVVDYWLFAVRRFSQRPEPGVFQDRAR